MLFFIIISLVLLIVIFFFASQFFNVIFRGYAPFISSKPEVIKAIMQEFKLKENVIVYELGCGKAGFLRAVEEKYPQAKLIGVEYSLLPYVVAQIQISLNKSKIKAWRKNLFDVNVGEADLIYCYLNPEMMKKLEEKFRKECKSGTKIISYAFAIPNMEPEKVIDLGNKGKIYFYTI